MDAAVLGAGVVGAANYLFGYNRSSWVVDVQVKQHRRFQKQEFLLSQAGMFRDDIRDLIGADTTRQNNLMLIVTLVLGMAGSSYCDSTFPDGAAEFVVTAYYLAVSSAIFYLLLSVAFVIGSNYLAVQCRRELLTNVVRLPILELGEEMSSTAFGGSIEAFEHQSAGTVFRVPGISRVSRGSQVSHADSPDLTSMSKDGKEVVGINVEQMKARRERYLQSYRKKEREWVVLLRYSIIYCILGFCHFLQAYSYYSAAYYYSEAHNSWSTAMQQFLLALLNCLIMLAFGQYMKDGRHCVGILESLFLFVSQASMFASVRMESVSFSFNMDLRYTYGTFVPLSFLMMFLFNVVGAHRVAVQPELVEETAADRIFKTENLGNDHTTVRRTTTQTHRRQQEKGRNRKVYGTCGLVCLAWGCTFAWSCWRASLSHIDRGHFDGALKSNFITPRYQGHPDELPEVRRMVDTSGNLEYGISDNESIAPHSDPYVVCLKAEVLKARMRREGLENRLLSLSRSFEAERIGRRTVLFQQLMDSVGAFAESDAPSRPQLAERASDRAI